MTSNSFKNSPRISLEAKKLTELDSKVSHGKKCHLCLKGSFELQEYERLSTKYLDAAYECNNTDCKHVVKFEGSYREAFLKGESNASH